MKTILSYLRPYKWAVTLAVCIKFIGTFADLALPYIIAIMIDDIIPLGDLNLIYLLGGAMVLISFFGVITNVVANRIAARVASKTTRDIRHDLFQKIESLSATQVDTLTTPSLIARMTSDTYNVHGFIGMIQRIAIRAPILLLGGIIVTLTIDATLTLVLIGTLPLIMLIIYYASKKGTPLFKKVQEAIDGLVLTLRENITGVRVIKSLGMGDHEKARFEEANEVTVDALKKAHITMAKINPSMNMIMNAGLIIVLLLGAFRIDQGLTKHGQIIAFVTYFTIILNAMMIITRIFVMFSRASASAARIEEVLDLVPTIIDGEEEITVMEDVAHIAFKQVDFSYNNKEANLKNISFSINKGQTLAIIGGTGSGKTTVINLILRFYDVNDGVIEIFGKDIKKLKQKVLRESIGVVLQHDMVFEDTVRENIRFNRSYITDEAIIKASQMAQAAPFIEDLTLQYDTELAQKGTNISGGQKQRLLISRALAGNPSILILDDASSALDYKTDASLRKDLKDQLKETTKIIIAQRISSVMHADMILVMDEGEIVAMGKHNDLIKTSPIYKEIKESQMGGDTI